MATSFSYDHVGLSVANLDSQRRFYTEAFALHEQNYAELAHPRTRIAFLRAATGLALELVERAGSAQHRSQNALEGAGLQSYFHWALAVTDLEDAIATAVAAGAELISAPAKAQRPGIHFAYIQDPEGNLIELVETDAGPDRGTAQLGLQPRTIDPGDPSMNTTAKPAPVTNGFRPSQQTNSRRRIP